jgi:fibro-slime domain-containing protein
MLKTRSLTLRPGRAITVALGLAALALVSPAGAQTGDPPSEVTLTGTAYDFLKSHPDFNVIPDQGFGLYAGNVDHWLDADGRPVYTGLGYRAGLWWYDANGNAIAPHLFNVCTLPFPDGGGNGGGESSNRLTLQERLKLEDGSMLDGFDSNVGPYEGVSAGQPHDDDDDDDDDDDVEETVGPDPTDGEGNGGLLAVVSVNSSNSGAVKVRKRSVLGADVLVGPDANLRRAVQVDRRSTVLGTIGHLDEVVEMPPIAEAPDVGDKVGKVKIRRKETTLAEDLHCDRLELDKGAVLNIEGDVTIVARKVELEKHSKIVLAPDATLTLYVSKKLELEDGSLLNMEPGNPQQVRVFMTGDEDESPKVELEDSSMMAAWIEGPFAKLELDDRSEFFGSFIGRKAKADDGSRIHVDMASGGDSPSDQGGSDAPPPLIVDCEDSGDVPGTVLAPSGGSIDSVDTFAQWYRDIPGVNLSGVASITLVRDASGVYEFAAGGFYPIDDQLLGNEGMAHNYNFTYHLAIEFDYEPGTGQYFELRKSSDMWGFLDGFLVVDLGGLGTSEQRVELDRFGNLEAGPMRFDLFYAQRRSLNTRFEIRTNIVLAEGSGGQLTVSGGGD